MIGLTQQKTIKPKACCKQNRKESLKESQKMFIVEAAAWIMTTIGLSVHPVAGELTHWPPGELNCAHGFRQFNPLTQKRVYHVGVHAPGGEEKAWREFNLTFETYLSHAVGRRWIPPIEFKMIATMNPLRDWVDNKADVDFMYSDT